MSSSIDRLPSEVVKNIAHYLPGAGALNLSLASKNLHSQLSLAATRPLTILTKFSRDECDDDMHYGFEVPKISEATVHSLHITMTWSDQGWGNKKGRLMLVAEDKNEAYDRSGNNRQGFSRVVYRSRIARHSQRRLDITFSPKQNESYHFWYKVGGGGGHSLELYNVEVQALAFDYWYQPIVKSSNFLAASSLLLPWDEMAKLSSDQLATAVLSSTTCLLREGKPILPPLVSYFERYGISESDLSLKFIESIETMLEDWNQRGLVYRERWRWIGNFGPEDSGTYAEDDIQDNESTDESYRSFGDPYESFGDPTVYPDFQRPGRIYRRRGFRRLGSFFRRR